jgi:hypothetical protein
MIRKYMRYDNTCGVECEGTVICAPSPKGGKKSQ